MKVKIFLALLVVLFTIPPLSAHAFPVTIFDTYWGATDHNYGDRIGNLQFEVEWMEIDVSGSLFTADIKTNYRGDADDGYTNLHTDFGDLFISIDGWHPDTTASNYLADNFWTGEDWEYAFDVSAGYLCEIDHDRDFILLAEDVMPPSGWTYRNGQEVLIRDQQDLPFPSVVSGGTASYVEDEGIYRISFWIPGGDNWETKELGFHWTMTCGNDVIEGKVSPVPEPTTMLFLGLGLVALAGVGRKLRRSL
jgi:hypothetical protein